MVLRDERVQSGHTFQVPGSAEIASVLPLPAQSAAPPALPAAADASTACEEPSAHLSSNAAGCEGLISPQSDLPMMDAVCDHRLDQAGQLPFLQGLTSDLVGQEPCSTQSLPPGCRATPAAARAEAGEGVAHSSTGSAAMCELQTGAAAPERPAGWTSGCAATADSAAAQLPESLCCQAGCSAVQQCSAGGDSAAVRTSSAASCPASSSASGQSLARTFCTPRQLQEGGGAASQQQTEEADHEAPQLAEVVPAAQQQAGRCRPAAAGQGAGEGEAKCMLQELHRVLEAGQLLEELAAQMQDAEDDQIPLSIR